MKFMGDVLAGVVIRVVATGRPLNANHPGPQIGEQPAGERAGPPDCGIEHRQWPPLGTERLPCGRLRCRSIDASQLATSLHELLYPVHVPSTLRRAPERARWTTSRPNRIAWHPWPHPTVALAIALAIAVALDATVEKVARLELRVREKVHCCHHLRSHNPCTLQQPGYVIAVHRSEPRVENGVDAVPMPVPTRAIGVARVSDKVRKAHGDSQSVEVLVRHDTYQDVAVTTALHAQRVARRHLIPRSPHHHASGVARKRALVRARHRLHHAGIDVATPARIPPRRQCGFNRHGGRIGTHRLADTFRSGQGLPIGIARDKEVPRGRPVE